MRITNKIIQNNALYNIGINKAMENDITTSIMTNKKINHPSDDPVIAIRSLSLRKSVTELTQYNTRNAEDAKAWLKATEGALSSTDAILTDMRKLLTSSPNKYKTVSDWDTLITQIESLAKEYYSTGNVDYAGRYIFAGYRTDSTLTYTDTTTVEYKNIHDQFNGSAIGNSTRITNVKNLADGSANAGNPTKEDAIKKYTVGRLRLSYDNVKAANPGDVSLKYKEPMTVPATSSVLPDKNNVKTVDLTFTDAKGKSHTVHLPSTNGKQPSPTPAPEVTIKNEDGTTEKYKCTYNSATKSYTVNATWDMNGTTVNETFTINEKGVINSPAMPSANVLRGTAGISESKVTKITFTPESSSTQQEVYIPLAGETRQPYSINLGGNYSARVNTDGTYTLESSIASGTPTPPDIEEQSVVQVNANGSVYSSYMEKKLKVDSVLTNTSTPQQIDDAYKDLAAGNKDIVFNSATGEMLFSDKIKDKLMRLKSITNAKSIDVVYDKSEFNKGDTRPEHLFTCTKEGVVYNSGSAGHSMQYDVGYNQTIEVNTTAGEVFTNDIRRDAQDLRNILNKMIDINKKREVLKQDYAKAEGNATLQAHIKEEMDAAKKAYDYLSETMKDEFGKKITSVTEAHDRSNIAVTSNGTRSKRLEMIQTRLTDQTATFNELKSENENVDLTEAASMLKMAHLTYEASIQATGKVLRTSLMDYI